MTATGPFGAAPAGGNALGAPEDELGRLKGQFLASLNHEIRTPLSGILGMTDLLLETALDGEQKEYVDAARLCAESLLAILNATLEFSDLSAGRMALDEGDFDLPDALRSMLAAFQSKAEAKGLKLVCSVAPDLPDVAVGDALRLRQLFSHLLDNAVKFTQKGEVELRATCRRPGETEFNLTVQIRDTGIGIPSEKLEAIFESFQQLDGGLSRAYAGLGLGLPIVQKVALLLKGSISVQSEVGRGSTFTVTLPLRISAELSAAESYASQAAQEGLQRRWRILVVEDNSVAQRVVSHILGRHDYEVTCASSGEDAIRLAAASPYDLILMDLQMPDMDGFETTRRIRALPGFESVPVVVLTANVNEEYRRLCRQQGMQGFLAKPVEAEELVSTLQGLLRQ